jgi:hypothetical protein
MKTTTWVWTEEEFPHGPFEVWHRIGYYLRDVVCGGDIGQPHPDLGRYKGPVGDDWDTLDDDPCVPPPKWSRLPLAAAVKFTFVGYREIR